MRCAILAWLGQEAQGWGNFFVELCDYMGVTAPGSEGTEQKWFDPVTHFAASSFPVIHKSDAFHCHSCGASSDSLRNLVSIDWHQRSQGYAWN
jgi:hypothetical protein